MARRAQPEGDHSWHCGGGAHTGQQGAGLVRGAVVEEGMGGGATRGEVTRVGRAIPGYGSNHVGEVDAGDMKEALKRGVATTEVIESFGGEAFEKSRGEDVVTSRDSVSTRVRKDEGVIRQVRLPEFASVEAIRQM